MTGTLTLRLAAALCALSLAPAAGADPMRPLLVPGKAPAAASAPLAMPSPTPAAPRPLGRLIAIRQDSQGRLQALIGDRWVGAGEVLDHATVAAITPNQVDLKIGKTRSTLHLLPPLQASAEPVTDRAVLALTERATTARTAGSPTR